MITTNPTSQSVTAGTSVNFTASASGNPTPTVQWQVSVGGGAFSNITGNASATTPTLTLPSVATALNGNQYRAVFTNSANSATTTPATLNVLPATVGSLSGTQATAASSYNLTSLGTSDWAHWGTGGANPGFNHKATGGSKISNFNKIGTGGSYGGGTNASRNVTWSDGTPLASDSGDHGYLWDNGAVGSGFSFTVPASTTAQTLVVYAGGYGASSTLTAHLSDGTPDYVATVNATTNTAYANVYTITFQAASAGQTLTISYVKSGNIPGKTNGSADLIAAMLH